MTQLQPSFAVTYFICETQLNLILKVNAIYKY